MINYDVVERRATVRVKRINPHLRRDRNLVGSAPVLLQSRFDVSEIMIRAAIARSPASIAIFAAESQHR